MEKGQPPNLVSSQWIDKNYSTEDAMWFDKEDEELTEIKRNLLEVVLEIIDKNLTEKQKKTLWLFMENYSQSKIAAEVGCVQSNVYKTLFGNDIYIEHLVKKHGGKVYKRGGVFKKLKMLCSADSRVAVLLKEIEEYKRVRNMR